MVFKSLLFFHLSLIKSAPRLRTTSISRI